MHLSASEKKISAVKKIAETTFLRALLSEDYVRWLDTFPAPSANSKRPVARPTAPLVAARNRVLKPVPKPVKPRKFKRIQTHPRKDGIVYKSGMLCDLQNTRSST